ncbi:hypothetical protein [Haladaptatus caseinilyticus]|uniref:hypothetical protein n=1 Tax=Haladaptatus caseinilyticus TaxID=2993314 RepID=UPI00224B6B93|nr:hypothetical protein [Haladaptatus caseinilyticus]
MSRTDSDDQLGFDQNVDYLGRALRAIVPQWVAQRSITTTVTTDRPRYEVGDEIRITVVFENRLPVPMVVETPRQRLWGWEVDGQLEASDQPYYVRDRPNAFYFRAREKKRAHVTWDGRFERRDESARVPAEPGEYTISAYLATDDERPRDGTTITLR